MAPAAYRSRDIINETITQGQKYYFPAITNDPTSPRHSSSHNSIINETITQGQKY